MSDIDIEQVVSEHGDYLFGFAMSRLGDEEVALDLVQESLYIAVKNQHKFLGQSQPRVWLAGIIKNKIFEYYRKRSRYEKMHLADDISELDHRLGQAQNWQNSNAPRGSFEPETELERKELLQAIYSCMKGLPEKTARVFALSEFDMLKTDEICNMLNISATNLRVILHRARNKLRECLELGWFDNRKK